MHYRFYKQIMDWLIALVTLLISSPIWFLLLILQTLIYHGKPFYVQKRPGYREVIFNLIKFRTMRPTGSDNSKRITPFGRILRATSLDELPQLLNVLKGEMSLVGPRPLLLEYQSMIPTEYKKRFEVKPGITGLVQVSGRTVLSWEKRFELDLDYVEKQSFWLDLEILLRTIPAIFQGDQGDPFNKYEG
jgi:lipopolysaccharide/colanic/teichoic acid biosynthesis glycosyltransferase